MSSVFRVLQAAVCEEREGGKVARVDKRSIAKSCTVNERGKSSIVYGQGEDKQILLYVK